MIFVIVTNGRGQNQRLKKESRRQGINKTDQKDLSFKGGFFSFASALAGGLVMEILMT